MRKCFLLLRVSLLRDILLHKNLMTFKRQMCYCVFRKAYLCIHNNLLDIYVARNTSLEFSLSNINTLMYSKLRACA